MNFFEFTIFLFVGLWGIGMVVLNRHYGMRVKFLTRSAMPLIVFRIKFVLIGLFLVIGTIFGMNQAINS